MEVHASPTLLLPSDSDGLQRSHLPVIDRQIIYTTSKLLLASPPSSPERQRSAIKPTSLVFSAVSPPPSSSVTQPPCNSKCKESNISAKATTPLRNRNDTPKISSREKQLQERVDALEALLAQVTASEEAARRQATDLQDALHDARLRVSQLEEDRKRSQYDGSQWQRTQAEWDEERSTLQTKLASRTAHNELLNNALSSLQTENSTLKGSLSEAESAIEKLNSELSAAQTQLASQTAEFAASSEANAVLGKENKRLVQDVSFLAAQLQQLTDLLHKLTAPGAAGNAPRSRPSSANESSVKMQSQGTEAAPALDAALHQEVARTHAAMAQAPPAMVQEAPLAEVSLQQMDQNVVQDAGQKPWPGSAEGVKAVTGATRHPSEERPQARPKAYSHFDSAKAIMTRTLELEDTLLALNVERSSLETELARMPCTTAGRTGALRRRRVDVEARLAELGKDIAAVKRELKSLGAM